MKKTILILAALACFLLSGCSDRLESGKPYPSMSIADGTVEYRLDKVMQNTEDVKPYFDFFDGISLSLTYEGGKLVRISFSENGAPFKVTDIEYTDVFESECEIYSAKSPYEIRLKGSGEVFCYITKDRMVTFPFKLGAPSNSYEYQFLPATGADENPSTEE